VSFEFVDAVTSDLCFVARGATLEAVFRAAGDALLAATLEEPEALGAAERRSLALVEPDRELLLLAYLNELIFLRDAERLLLRAHHLELTQDGDARLGAELAGERIDPARHRLLAEVKAATAHGLRVSAVPGGGFEARVTLDV
jgi:SHS2 domain-containing protein